MLCKKHPNFYFVSMKNQLLRAKAFKRRQRTNKAAIIIFWDIQYGWAAQEAMLASII